MSKTDLTQPLPQSFDLDSLPWDTFALSELENCRSPYGPYYPLPLSYAILTGNLPTVQLLLELGADPHLRDDSGVTPMGLVVLRSRTDTSSISLEMLQLLLMYGVPSALECTMHITSYANKMEILLLLLEHMRETEIDLAFAPITCAFEQPLTSFGRRRIVAFANCNVEYANFVAMVGACTHPNDLLLENVLEKHSIEDLSLLVQELSKPATENWAAHLKEYLSHSKRRRSSQRLRS